MGNRNYGIDPERLSDYANEIKQLTNKGIEVAIVIGGGNICLLYTSPSPRD